MKGILLTLYNYQYKWYIRTLNTPTTQGNSWVVTRKVQGTKTTRGEPTEYKLSDNTWVNETEWKGAVRARAQGNETTRQREILDKGHLPDE